jgi:hypothetical protein
MGLTLFRPKTPANAKPEPKSVASKPKPKPAKKEK